jgi:hypothetical protein
LTIDFGKLTNGKTFILATAVFLMIFPLFILSGCTSGSKSPEDHLNAFCVRQCVRATADPEVCDTRCNCAVKKLSSEMSGKEFSSLVERITGEDTADAEDLSRFNEAFQTCKSIK